MKKPKVHKLDLEWHPLRGVRRMFGYSRCYRFLLKDQHNWSEDWRGVTCKICLRAKGKR